VSLAIDLETSCYTSAPVLTGINPWLNLTKFAAVHALSQPQSHDI